MELGSAGNRSAADALRESESRYRSIFEAATDGMIINDFAGNTVEVNAAFCRLHGFTRDELVGRSHTAWVPADHEAAFLSYLETVKAGGSFATEGFHTRKDGSRFPVEVRGATFTYAGRPHVLGIVRDLSERMRVEQALQEERLRLSRELHDSVSQALYGIALGARTARQRLEREPATAIEPLEYVLSLADVALAEMRAVILDLRPEMLEQEGLVAAFRKQALSAEARHGLVVRVVGDEPALPMAAKEALYRIGIEALNNAVKHAGAHWVEIRVLRSVAEAALEVTDDGRGFDPQQGFPGHVGLRSMRERAERLGGELQVHSELGRGTRVLAHVPVRGD